MAATPILAPAKQAPGKAGTPFPVTSNLLAVQLREKIAIYKYDLRIFAVFTKKSGDLKEVEVTIPRLADVPRLERLNACTAILRHAVAKESDFFKGSEPLAYDRVACLYTPKKLAFSEDEKHTLMFKPSEVKDLKAFLDATSVRLEFKYCREFKCSTADLGKNLDDHKYLLEYLNILTSMPALRKTDKLVCYDHSKFYLLDPRDANMSDRDVPALPEGKYLGVGLAKTVRVVEGRGDSDKVAVVISVDVKKTAFESETTLDVKWDAVIQGRTESEAIKLIRGLHVTTTYKTPSGRTQTFEVDRLGLPANQATLKLQLDDGSEKSVTVAEYFKSKYNVVLKRPELKVVVPKGRELYYPMELLGVAESQRVTFAHQTPRQVEQMIRACAVEPATRHRQTVAVTALAGLSGAKQEEEFAKIGMALGNPISINARVLPSPSIRFGASSVQVQDNCKWRPAPRFAIPAECSKWGAFSFLDRRDENCFQPFVNAFQGAANRAGMRIAPPSFSQSYDSRRADDGLKQAMDVAKKQGLQFVLVVSSPSVKIHNHLKLIEASTGIITQEVSARVASMAATKPVTFQNLLAKTNLKLGGYNYEVAADNNPLIPGGMLIIGFEMSHPAPGTQGDDSVSVLGWSANVTAQSQAWVGGYKYVPMRQANLGEDGFKILKELTHEIVGKFRASHQNRVPAKVVIYRNGISDKELTKLARDEAGFILKSLADEGIESKNVAYVVVSKLHGERFFRNPIPAGNCTAQNIPPGLIVDSGVVSATHNEFYLNAHLAFQGSAKTPRYTIIHGGIPMEYLERLTHGLAFTFGIVPASISLPGPAMVANRYAKRGLNNFSAHYASSSSISGPPPSTSATAATRSAETRRGNATKANELLVVADPRLEKVRYNA